MCPVIPHSVLEGIFNNLNVTLESKISFIRAGYPEPGLTHILSFRRQVYVDPSDLAKIPESLKVTFENTSYWIYFSTDSLTCFHCKEEGHLARNCPKQQQTYVDNTPAETENATHIPEIPENVNTSELLSDNTSNHIQTLNIPFEPTNTDTMMQTEASKETFKRPLPSTSSESFSSSQVGVLSGSNSSLDSLQDEKYTLDTLKKLKNKTQQGKSKNR